MDSKNKYPYLGFNQKKYLPKYPGEVAEDGKMTCTRMYTSSSAPGVTNDGVDSAGIDQAFEVGDFWNLTGTRIVYKCEDNSTGAADWQAIYDPNPTFETIILTGEIAKPGTYGGIHVHDASTAQSIPTGATYTKFTCFTDNSLHSNVTPDVANDKIIITRTGVYRVNASLNGSSGTPNITFRTTVFLGGVEQDQVHAYRKYVAANDNGSCSLTGFIDVTAVPAGLDLRTRHANGGSINFTMVYANLNVQYVGET